MREDSIPRDLVDLALWMAEEYCSTPARALALVTPPPGKAKTMFWAAPTGAEGRLNDNQRALLDRLPGPAGGDLAALRRLEKRGLVEITARVARRAPRTNPAQDRVVEPTAAQAAALAAIEAAPGEAHLLHGVTGSGKTEVYLRAAAAALERGEGVIALVPEIALTPQTVARFAARFGDTVALLHSALSEGERYDEWRRLRTGEARIAVGPRSAIFAPVERLGLIVVDEEHDASYKQESDPRYDARHVAAFRAYQSGARLLAGSATPRPETVHRMKRLRLPGAGGRGPQRRPRPRPARRAVAAPRASRRAAAPPPRAPTPAASRPCACSTCAARTTRCTPRRGARSPPRASRSCCSTGAGGRTSSPAAAAGRRGSAPTATSRSSCTAPRTRSRAITAATASASRAAATPAARSRSPATARAPSASRPSWRPRSTCPVFRLDADTAANKDAVPELLARFHAAPAGLLLGTQMVAKGHDFPDVTLGVVLDADSTLRFPDFRAEERTFALIAQLAGRAGRGPRGGRVLVQTNAPDAPAIAAAARHDADGFLKAELERRRAHGYPPFADLIRVDHERAGARPGPRRRDPHRRSSSRLEGTELLGPAPLFRLRGRERYQLVLKTTERAAAIARHRRRRRGHRPRPRVPRRQPLRRRRSRVTSPLYHPWAWRTRFTRRRTARSPSRRSG